jgi:hypothetical protein
MMNTPLMKSSNISRVANLPKVDGPEDIDEVIDGWDSIMLDDETS